MNNERSLFVTAIVLVVCASCYENYLNRASMTKDQESYNIDRKMQKRDQNGNESCELNNISSHTFGECVLVKPVRNNRHNNSIWNSASFTSKLLLCFSYKSNLGAIFTTGRSDSSSGHSLRCIHGIRLLTLLWYSLLQLFAGCSRFFFIFQDYTCSHLRMIIHLNMI